MIPLKLKSSQLKLESISWPLVLFFLANIMQSPLINKATIFLFIAYLFIVNFRDTASIVTNGLKAYGLVLLLIWELLSIFWSKSPITSIRAIGNDLELFICSTLLAYHARNKDVLYSLKLSAILAISLALAYCIAFPGASITSIGLKSFYNHKNNFGFSMAICVLIVIFSFKNRLLDYFFFIISAIFLILSQSKTSLNLTWIVLFLFGISYLIKRFYSQLSPYTQGFIKLAVKLIPITLYILIIVGVIFREAIADYLIQIIPDDALTGRGLLWSTVLSRTRDDLLTGLGPGVFWGADRMSEIAQTALYEQQWIRDLRAADGGYIDVIASIGFVGLALVFLSMIQLYKFVFNAPRIKVVDLAFALTTLFILHNLTESDFFRPLSMLWFLFEFLTFYLIFLTAQEKENKLKTAPSIKSQDYAA